jgi:Flp pilus assembly pilin Flp
VKRLRSQFGLLCADSRGFTALEYTLITVIFGTVVAVGVDVIGNALTTSYVNISSVLAQYAAGS